jgi:hypothetical protein
VSLHTLAPDLVASELTRALIRNEELKEGNVISASARTKVYTAKLGDETVVVKQFVSDSHSAAALAPSNQFSDFRSEAWVLRYANL